jgi:hypothetical protein
MTGTRYSSLDPAAGLAQTPPNKTGLGFTPGLKAEETS